MSSKCNFWSCAVRALGLALCFGVPPPLLAAEQLPDAVIELQGTEPITAQQVAKMRIIEGSILPSEPATIKAMNRAMATLRATANGWSAKTRAELAQARIARMLAQPGRKSVSLLDRKEGIAVLVNDELMFAVLLQDTVESTPQAARLEAQEAAATLELAIEEYRESRDLRSMLIAGAIALAVTLLVAVLLRLLYVGRRSVQGWLARKTVEHSKQLRVGGMELLSRERLISTQKLALNAAYWLLILLLVYQWLGVVLALFPYTRVWAVQINGFLFSLATSFGLAVAHAIPDAFAATLIFALAYGVNRMLKRFFKAVEWGFVKVTWLDAEVALVTSRLCSVVLWVFALAMAYPYLPGSDTDAFKGLSVLLGLMISLGASNLVGQGASGLILTYSRTFRNGEYVRVADHEGTVVNLGAFTTRIRTGLGEELTISNSLVLGAVTKNYSRAVKGQGYVLDATVTIGYDTPWRQVTVLLEEAAQRTPGVLDDPKPRVSQTALSDFYPEYRLVCQAIPTEPRPRAEVMDALHANIQDVFNEHGVQIMSPHYVSDPQQAKVVPPEQCYAAPAKPPAP